MHKSVDVLAGEAALLSKEDRLVLIDRILETVHPTDAEDDAAWIAEGEARMAAYERGEVETFDADEVLAEMRARPRRRRA
jgi:putative addiction module component (TIGR02574 family)